MIEKESKESSRKADANEDHHLHPKVHINFLRFQSSALSGKPQLSGRTEPAAPAAVAAVAAFQRHRSSAPNHQSQWPHSLPGRALKAPRGFHPGGVPGQRRNPEQSLRCPTSPLLANLNQAQWVQEKYVGTMNPLKIQRKHPKVSHELHQICI